MMTLKNLLTFVAFSLFASMANAKAEMYYVHSDHLGTPQVLTDKDQQVVWERSQTPFGETVEESGTVVQPLRFPGQYEDPETGFHYNYFRDYDPAIGRYVQSDPIGLRAGLNTYAYVGGKPHKYIDPFGLMEIFSHPQKTGSGTESRYQFDFNPLNRDAGDMAKKLNKWAKRVSRVDPSRVLNPEPVGPRDADPFQNPKRYWECGVLDDDLKDGFKNNYDINDRLTRSEAEDFLKDMHNRYPKEMSDFYDSPINMLNDADDNARGHWWNETFYPEF